MIELSYKTINNSDTQGKPRVYFTCHPHDFSKTFEKICEDIFKTHDCVIYYTEDMEADITEQEAEILLGDMNLFVIPVTQSLLTTYNRAMDADFIFAQKEHIPVLPIIFAEGLDELYSRKDRFGELQYLNPYSKDTTEILYEDKLKRYLESVLISKEMADRVKTAFDAYIFLSYRKKDRQYANQLMKIIHDSSECRSIAIWFDEFLTPGESFKENIERILSDSKLFALLVTPSLLEEPDGKPNFVMDKEFPMARDSGMKILPAQMVDTDSTLLKKKFNGIPECLSLDDEQARKRFVEAIGRYARHEKKNDPVHNFLIGLAYLNGIDMEINRERAVGLITGAANDNLPEAMQKLIAIYTDGDGVESDATRVELWSNKLAEYYFEQCFSCENADLNQGIVQVFSNYKDEYWHLVIIEFMLKADRSLDMIQMNSMLNSILECNISDFTLLFDSCVKMETHREFVQKLLVKRILEYSATGIYPAYGPLFWYIPEYNLYEMLLCVMDDIKYEPYFEKALALTRDVCFIFGNYTRASEVTDKVNACSLFDAANHTLAGVRRALCSLFYCGETDYEGGTDIYPRCFNVAEAKLAMDKECGLFTRMNTPFEDELGLYLHNDICKMDSHIVGLISLPYNASQVAKCINATSGNKIRGLILTPTEETTLTYIGFYRKNIKVFYIPENIIQAKEDSRTHMDLTRGVAANQDGIVYFTEKLYISNTEKIDNFMFAGNRCVRKVILAEGTKEIGHGAFLNCKNMEEIHIPDSVEYVGDNCFAGCVALKKVILPLKLNYLGWGVFNDCSSMTEVRLPDNIQEIKAVTFYKCTSLSHIEIPDSVTSIGDSALADTSSLEEIVLPQGITEIVPRTFMGSGIKRIEMSDKITEIGMRAFWGSGLVEINIPANVKTICQWAFADCSNLERVNFNYGLEIIENNAFTSCSSLKYLYIPETVREIWYKCFQNNSLEKIVAPYHLCDLSPEQGIYDETELEFYGECPPQKDFFTEFIKKDEEPEYVELEMQTVYVPEGVTEIGREFFTQYAGLNKVVLPDSIKKINDSTFEECRYLEEINIPFGVEYIGDNAFASCFRIKKLHIPASVTYIGKAAFRGLIECKRIELDANIKKIEEMTFASCYNIEKIRIPDGVEFIGWNAFCNCQNIREVILPNTVRYLDSNCFERCKNLTKINLPDGLESIEIYAFSRCESLKEIVIPPTVRYMGEESLATCLSLKRLTLPANLKDDLVKILCDTEVEIINYN